MGGGEKWPTNETLNRLQLTGEKREKILCIEIVNITFHIREVVHTNKLLWFHSFILNMNWGAALLGG